MNTRRKARKKSGYSRNEVPGAPESVSESGVCLDQRRKGREAVAVALFVLAVFLSLSLVSLTTAKAASDSMIFSSSPPVQSSNIMGPSGHLVATILLGFLGWGAWLPVLWLFYLAVIFILPRASVWSMSEENFSPIKLSFQLVVGLAGTLIFSSVLFSTIWGSAAGGLTGTLVSEPMLRFFEVSGTTLLSSLFLLFFVSFSVNRSLLSTLASIFNGLKVLLLSVVAVAYLFFASIRVILLKVHSILKRAFFFPASTEDEDEQSAVSVSDRIERQLSRRRARLKNKDSSVDSQQKLSPASEEVIVRRRNNALLRSKMTRKKRAISQSGMEQELSYVIPQLELLTRGEAVVGSEDDKELLATSSQIEAKLRDFSILGRVTEVHPGPVITLFEFEPAPGVKVGKIAALQDDLAMSLKASSIRIIAPIPRKGTVGIEVPNRQRNIVRLRELLESEAFLQSQSTLSLPLGKDTYGDPVVVDIASMPHLLMAGATGTGKSVCINALLVSLLYRASPQELGLILIDPKVLELSIYDGIPHLRVPVVTVPRQAKAVLEWAVKEMDRRYRMMQRYGVRNIDSYNRIVAGEKDSENLESETDIVTLKEELVIEPGDVDAASTDASVECSPQQELQPLQKIVIVIDELADLMLTVGRDIEELITRLAQKARAAGIHLILATQRPSVDVITGLIKANFPARLSFRVSSRIDSRTILDAMGAEKLLGKGDMLFNEPGSSHARRIHGAYITDKEVKNVVDAIKAQGTPSYDQKIMEICARALEEEESGNNSSSSSGDAEEYDAMYDEAVQLVIEKGYASTSMIQRVFRIGYNRAARIIETMEKEGVVGPMDGSKPREVLAGQIEQS